MPQTSAVTAQPFVKTGVAKISGGAQQWGIPGTEFTVTGVSAMNVNEARYIMFTVRYPLTITAQQFEVSTGPVGAANVRVGIYLADADLQPTGAPLYDSGSIAVAGAFTGLKTTSSLSVFLSPGVYLTVLNVDTALTLRTITSPSPVVLAAIGATPVSQRFSIAQTYGSFPSPGTKWTALNAVSAGLQNIVVYQWTI